jgi:hypothetical protein
MPVFDPLRRCLVVRVIYDGPAFGGKTTNLKQICEFFPVERRTEMYTPGSLRGRTMFFDWLEIEAGKVGAYPLRLQLLTVPGQGERSYRRRPLLESADGVVFVCDSAFTALPTTKKSFSQLRAMLRKRLPASVPYLVQANKQDTPDALPPEELALVLKLDPSVTILGAAVQNGQGVRETVVGAIRMVVREVQQQITNGGLHSIIGESQTADQLFDAMLALEDIEEHETMETDPDYDREIEA